MHKIILCTLAGLAVALAAPRPQEAAQDQQAVYIVNHDSNVSPDGYNFSFQTSDGTSRQEQGSLKQVSEDLQAIEVSGSYSYVAPDGLTYSVSYTADTDGFKPQSHIGQGEQHQQPQ
ncbi:hypothetical protein O0L34_g1656 [Tuta absoluta]|nr:hypothetical protein O0L34_g1656 [Tuta absoluta]